ETARDRPARRAGRVEGERPPPPDAGRGGGMSGYTVEWLEEAENDLADAWLRAADRQAGADAQAPIDRLPNKDPGGDGEEVREGLWKIAVPPLTAYYEIDSARQHVSVSNVILTP